MKKQKNKNAIYVLIPAVLLIWGIIFYKIFINIDDVSKKTVDTTSHSPKDGIIKTREHFSLYVDYNDPFLRERATNEQKEKRQKGMKESQKNRTSRRRISHRNRWPDIKYKGVIRNRNKDESIVLIEINKQKYLFHKGDTIKEVFLKSFTEDSARLIFQNDQRVLSKNKN